METDLDTVFEDFIEKISLTRTQRDRIDNTVNIARDLFRNVNVNLQGSFATGTTVRPLTANTSKYGIAGEYDADIALTSDHWDQPTMAFNEVLELLDGAYGDKVDTNEKHNSCERVYFAEEATGVAFHADYVPLRIRGSSETECGDRKQNQWKLSPTFQIIDCYNNFGSANPYASSCLLILKRLRDFSNHMDSVPSIVLLSLVYSVYIDKGSYVYDLMHLTENIIAILGNNTSIVFYDQAGTALTEELHQKIENKDQIIQLMTNFHAALKQLTISNLSSMKEHLSSDFPTNQEDFPIQMESLRSHGFSYDTLNGLEIIEIDSVEHGSRFFKRFRNAMQFSQNVSMKLQPTDQRELNSRNLNARWRITNDKYKVPQDIRGRLMPREKGNEFIRKETARYDGLHRAELFVFEKGSKKIIAKGRYKVRKVKSL